MTADDLERRLPLQGASNFRDLGGYRSDDGRMLRWRKVFRSDALDVLEGEDVSMLVDLGLGAVFDLRTQREIEAFGTNPLCEHGVRYHHVPFVADIGMHAHQVAVPLTRDDSSQNAAEIAAAYLQLLDDGRETVARVLAHAAEIGEGSMVFHCTGGRDRAGLMAAMLLCALGMPRDVISADYALTSRYLQFSEERIRRLREVFGDVVESSGPPPTVPEVMRRTLEGLDERYGSPAAYLDRAGFSASHREALRAQLLEG